jgi:hypothetical protein
MYDFAVLEAPYLVGRQRDVVRPPTPKVESGNFALPASHGCPTIFSIFGENSFIND